MPKGWTWPNYVRKHFDLGQSRADELIRIAKGTTTVAQVRAGRVESVQKVRDKPALRSAGSDNPDVTTGSRAITTTPQPETPRERHRLSNDNTAANRFADKSTVAGNIIVLGLKPPPETSSFLD